MRILISAFVLFFSIPTFADECKRVTNDSANFDRLIEAKKAEFAKLPANPNDKEWVKAKIRHMVDVWFKISEFGNETSLQAWLLAQHADLDRAFQKEVLAILEKLYPIGEVDRHDYAYLYDRVTWFGDGKPQRYATQGECKGAGNWQPFPTEDIENADARRASMGIEPLAETKKRLDQNCQ